MSDRVVYALKLDMCRVEYGRPNCMGENEDSSDLGVCGVACRQERQRSGGERDNEVHSILRFRAYTRRTRRK